MRKFMYMLYSIFNTVSKHIFNVFLMLGVSVVVGLITNSVFWGFIVMLTFTAVAVLYIFVREIIMFVTKRRPFQIRSVVIPKGLRRPFPYFFKIPQIKIFAKNSSFSITKNYCFTDSTLYNFDSIDQLSINKLFGASVGSNHHKESYRFGWRPNNNVDGITIFKYEYVNGLRYATPLTDIELNKMYKFTIRFDMVNSDVWYIISYGSDYSNVNKSNLWFDINNKFIVWGYTLGLYFGGKRVAPHKIVFKEQHTNKGWF